MGQKEGAQCETFVWLSPLASDRVRQFTAAALGQGKPPSGETLVAPYRAVPRDYLSDTPLLRAMGFLVSQHGELGAIPPPPFLSVSPWRACEVEVRYPPFKRGISATLARYPMKTREMGAIPLSAILSRKGIVRYGGGISHWAAKGETP